MISKCKNEEKGVELFISDPLLYGNFSSWLSHSCDANCKSMSIIYKN